ncbi:pirin family protein [Blastococcus xanthinilyticus]|uniref:Pirin N-terminal domain-containing protein n=1 Tax=Blastococcus xanthinilyticus TaxID=1564164 RepID=A0A5S5CXL6_9ACTN|nr:pirin family protein [Blastococcus xanthinilyticus]TYP88530.1 hypothetical protein BD833_104236 [Blastococcus xanthinilyticus]
MTALDSRAVLAPGDGSLGPLLRVTDDRLAPGAGYGRHDHRAVDVVAVVLSGSLDHRWGTGAVVSAGDVAVLRAGAGLAHDEVAGADGARVLQCYLRSAAPGEPAGHEVHRAAGGWVDLRRPDARLWVGPAAAGPPPGLALAVGEAEVRVLAEGEPQADGAGTVVVWQVDEARPAWAEW